MIFSSINQLLEYIHEDHRRIVLTSHQNPDGDAIGSTLGLMHIFRKLGHSSTVIVPNSFPGFLGWMPGSEHIIIFDENQQYCNELINDADLIFSLDYNAIHRVDKMKDSIVSAKAYKILIDHHLDPVISDFDFIISDHKKSSTSELVFDFIINGKFGLYIDKAVAECLYAGIVTDTGSFSYNCNNPDTWRTVASLIDYKIDTELIHRLIYDTYSEHRMRLLGFSLSDRMKVFPQYHTAYIFLTQQDLINFNYQVGDTEGLVNYPLSIDGIQLSALFTERRELVRISLRSKGCFSVNIFAREHFNGGGHKNAAGANSYHSIEKTTQIFENLLPLYKDELSLHNPCIQMR